MDKRHAIETYRLTVRHCAEQVAARMVSPLGSCGVDRLSDAAMLVREWVFDAAASAGHDRPAAESRRVSDLVSDLGWLPQIADTADLLFREWMEAAR